MIEEIVLSTEERPRDSIVARIPSGDFVDIICCFSYIGTKRLFECEQYHRRLHPKTFGSSVLGSSSNCFLLENLSLP